jgi:CheY-like chemotaxis protein
MHLVYIVDDSADYRFLLQHFISRFLPDYPVMFFDGAKSLFDHLLTFRNADGQAILPSLIILDLNMPEMDGYQIIRLIKQPDDPKNEKWKEISVVFNSSNPREEVVKKCYEAGASAFFNKSADFDNLKNLCGYLTSHAESVASGR